MKKTIAIILLFTSMAAHSDELKKMTIGAGNQTCGRYINSEPFQKVQPIAWVLGYLTAQNFHRPGDFLANTDSEAIQAAIDLYCKANPLQPIITAGAYVMLQLINQSK